jgi:hypothetical protein
LQHALARIREPLELPAQHVAHAPRDRQALRQVSHLELAVRGQLGELRDEQCVTGRGREDRFDDLGRGRLVGCVLEQHAHRVATQALQVDPLGERLARAGREHTGERALRPRRIPKRRDQVDARVLQRRDQVVEQQQARLVGPVQVVDHQEQRLRLAHPLQQHAERFEEA